MPRRKRNRKRRTGPRNSGTRNLRNESSISRISGRAFLAGPVANGTTGVFQEINLIPSNLGNRIAAIASDFQFWRITHLHVKTVLRNSNSFPVHAIGFIPVPPAYFTAASTFAQLVDFPVFAYNGVNMPSSCNIDVKGNALTSYSSNRWLTTDATGVTDTLFYSAGTVTLGLFSNTSDTTSNIECLLEVMVEFRSPIDPALSLVPRSLADRKDDEKKNPQLHHDGTTLWLHPID